MRRRNARSLGMQCRKATTAQLAMAEKESGTRTSNDQEEGRKNENG